MAAVALCLNRRDVSLIRVPIAIPLPLCNLVPSDCQLAQESGKQEHKSKNKVVTYLMGKRLRRPKILAKLV